MDNTQLYELLDRVLALYADVEPVAVSEVLSGDYNGSDQHRKFAMWCVCDKDKFKAACILAGAKQEQHIEELYNRLNQQANQ